jgi:hypothetical protein
MFKLGLACFKFFSIFFLLLLIPEVQAYSIDNTCNTCSRRELDSLNVFHRRAIRINQVGYRPQDMRKIAFVANPSVSTYSVINAQSGAEVLSGALEYIQDAPAGQIETHMFFNSLNPLYTFTGGGGTESLYRANFSNLSTPGQYYLVSGGDTSGVFRIDSRLYNHIFETSLKFFGAQRCGDTDSWMHGACHLQDGSDVGMPGSLTGGWHDCGDHGKYSETVGYAANILSLVYVLFPEKAEDFYGASYADTLPFGTDGIPDILWEAKVGADYIFKLYQKSVADGLMAIGDMYHSVGTGPGVDHAYWDIPERQDAQPYSEGGPDRPVTAGIGSNVAGMYAASLAFFAYGWELFDPAYSTQLLNAAKDIYEKIILARPNSTTSMPCCYPGGGRRDDDEAMAALALWYATKDPVYGFNLLKNTALGSIGHAAPGNGGYLEFFPAGHLASSGSPFHHGGWTTDYEQTHVFVLYGLAKLILKDDATAAQFGLTPAERTDFLARCVETIRRSIEIGSSAGNGGAYPGIGADEPYHLVYTDQDWGFNRYNMGMVNELFIYWDLTGNQMYFDIAMDNMNYDLGLNPWDISFLMGAGDRNQQHPHNRAANPEGYNAGGFPYEYKCPKGALMGGIMPTDVLIDHYDMWTKTETCIDFSATFILPAQLLAEDLPPDVVGPVMSSVIIDPIGNTSAFVTWQTNELSVDVLKYSLTPGGTLLGEIPAGALAMNKSVIIEGLTPATTYYFMIEGMDVRRNVSVEDNHGEWYSFTTTTTPIPPAQNQGIRVCNITDKQATVYWWTPNGAYTSGVEYGTTPALGTTVSPDDTGLPDRFHQVTLKGLAPNTTYYFDVISGTTRDDNNGNHYQFTTTERFVDLDIRLKANNGPDGDALLHIAITNDDNQPYTGLEFRFYFTGDATMASQFNMYFDVASILDVNATPIGSANPTVGPAQLVPGYTDQYYVPITITATIPVQGLFKAKARITGQWQASHKWSALRNAWSIRPHLDPSDPVQWEGLDIDNSGSFTDDKLIEVINGVNAPAWLPTQYITAYFNGEHIYGYPPDHGTNSPQFHRTVRMLFTAPFASPQTAMETDETSVDFAGRAWAFPDGLISHVEMNADPINLSLIGGNVDSVTFNHNVNNLNYGGNSFTFVAWHNRDQADCACIAQRINIERDTLNVARERRIISLTPADTLNSFQGKRQVVQIRLTNESGTIVTSEALTVALVAGDARIRFYLSPESTVPLTAVTLQNGVAEVWVYSDDVIMGSTITVSASNPLPQYLYISGRIGNVNFQERPPFPIIESAKMVDTNCDLIPDQLILQLDKDFLPNQVLSSVSYVFGSDSVNIRPAQIIQSSMQLRVTLPNSTLINTDPSGRAYLFLTENGQPKSHSELYGDGAGPGIQGASILEQIQPGQTRDSLFIKFTEKVSSAGTNWIFNLYESGVLLGESPIILNAMEYNSSENIWLFVIDNSSGDNPVREGLEIQLQSEAPITDLPEKNPVGACTFDKFVIRTKYRPVPMEYAEIFDNDGNGRADRIRIQFVRPVDNLHLPDSLQVIFGLAVPETLTTNIWSFLDDERTTMELRFEVNAINQKSGEVLGQPKEFLARNTRGNYEGVYQGQRFYGAALVTQFKGAEADFESLSLAAKDLVGPNIIRAVFHKGSSFDSLVVQYSEPVSLVAGDNQIFRSRGEVHLIPEFQKFANDSMSATYYYYDESPGAIKTGDLIRVATISAQIQDQNGNISSPQNPLVQVVGARSFRIKTDFNLNKNLVQVDPSNLNYRFDKQIESGNHFGVSLLLPGTTQLTWDQADVFEKDPNRLTHVGPAMNLTIELPTGASFGQDPLWDMVILSLELQFFDNLGQYVNDFQYELVLLGQLKDSEIVRNIYKDLPIITAKDYLDENDRLSLNIEWLVHSQKGLLSKTGRAIGTGAYVTKSSVKVEMLTNPRSGITGDEIEDMNESKSFSDTRLFGFRRF